MERRIRLGVLFTFCYLFIVSVSNADTSSPIWTISERLGTVEIRDTASGDLLDTEPDTRLRAPFIVTTGSDGYIVLRHGEDKASVNADSSLTVSQPEPYAQGIITRIKQAFGSVLYQVEHRDTDGFAVDTPYLVSVVKGTTFNILVSADASTVSLIEGLLLVYTPDGRSHVMLKPGQTAIKSRLQNSIIVKDQHVASAPVKGPITIVRETNVREGDTNIGLETLMLDLTAGNQGVGLSVEGLQTPNGALVTNDSAVNVGGVSINRGVSPSVEVGDTTVTVGGASVTGTALTPAVTIGDTSASLGGVSVEIDSTPQVELDTTTVEVGEIAIGETALTPGVDVGGAALSTGSVDLSLDTTPTVDIGETSLDVGSVSIDDTALTPAIDISDTSISTSGVDAGSTLGLNVDDIVTVDTGLPGTTVNVDLPEVSTDITTDISTTVTNTTSTVVDTVFGLLPGL